MAPNPLLSEIQTKGPTSPLLSPGAQNAARMAGYPAPAAATQAPSMFPPGSLLPPSQPEPTNLITMPGQTPSLSFPSTPSLVTGPKKGQAILSNGAQPSPSQAHMAELNRLVSEGPGEDQLYGKITGSHFGQAHPLLGKLLGGLAEGGAKLADVGVSAVAPELTMATPGTAYHHDLLLKQAKRTVGQDDANAQKEAQTAAENATAEHTAAETQEVAPNAASARGLQGAETQHTGAETHALENPVATTPELGTYRALVQMGMSPSEALQEIEKDKQLALAPKNMTAKTLDVPGKGQVAGKVDSQGNLLLADGSPAPPGSKLYQQPNYGMMILPTKTQQITDPNTGLPTVMGWDEKTQKYDIPQGTSGSGTYGHQIQSAAAINRMLYKSIYPLVGKMEKSNELGPIQGRFSDWLNRDIGNAPPDVAQFHQLINGVVSMMMGMYGFRRQQAVEQLDKQMGARMTPESLRAALQGIEQHADSIIGGAVNEPGNRPDAQGNQDAGGQSGFKVRLSDAMALPQNKGKSAAQVEADVKAHGGSVVK